MNTCHWIDDNFTRQKCIIAFKYDIDQSHIATFISTTIIELWPNTISLKKCFVLLIKMVNDHNLLK